MNLVIIDPFPPGPHDPYGIHSAIWRNVCECAEPALELPAGKTLTLAAYQSAQPTAFFDPIGPGDLLTEMPLFLHDDRYVSVPLEETYQRTWNALPVEIERLLFE
jgi:hypothetical protein